jgi:hypothetical protein
MVVLLPLLLGLGFLFLSTTFLLEDEGNQAQDGGTFLLYWSVMCDFSS